MTGPMPLARRDLLPEAELPDATTLISEGWKLAQAWRVQPGAFLNHYGVISEAEFKRAQAVAGEIMLHAQIGYRDLDKSKRAWGEIFDRSGAGGSRLVRYGICLDWTMGLPRCRRENARLGTGLVLHEIDDFKALCQMAPVAPHFGDFVLGFPASVENTCAALQAGSTAIGNLGQYFTFRLPGWDDDVTSTQETVKALALLAAQPVEILIHSNLDDGFAALFQDLASSYGAVLLERHIVETLLGGHLSTCWGHHFSDPERRLAFHLALAQDAPTPGTMIYGNTTAYRGTAAENYASLARYLMTDILGQRLNNSGHALNPIPVMENHRIPDIDEVAEAQLFAHRLIEHSMAYEPHLDADAIQPKADAIRRGGEAFFERAMTGLAEAEIDTNNPVEMLLALKRMGGRRLELAFGAQPDAPRRPITPVLASPIAEEITEQVGAELGKLDAHQRTNIAARRLSAITASSDVHEHGKLILEGVLDDLKMTVIDGGISVDPSHLAELAQRHNPDVLMISTYNGVALSYFRDLKRALDELNLQIPVLIGGRLNQIPDHTNSSMPVDVTGALTAAGALVCHDMRDAAAHLNSLCPSPGSNKD